MNSLEYCEQQIETMLKRSQTKIIFPIMVFGILQEYLHSGKAIFPDQDIKASYRAAVRYMIDYLNHNMHIGGKYYDAYPSRNLPKYGVLKAIENKVYELQSEYRENAEILIDWIPNQIKDHIDEKLGGIPGLNERASRISISERYEEFIEFVNRHIIRNPTNFEIFSFAIIKVHLEKFACKIYRDNRTSASDGGVDLSTNFGVVYQVKKLKVRSMNTADSLYDELRRNFDNERLEDGNVILIIDDIAQDIKKYLIDMKVQSISTNDMLKLASQFDDIEDREKILRIIFDEFRREYSSDIE